MKNIKITIEYDGSRYCGWQMQKNEITIQQKLEEALEKLCGERIQVIGSGRTDSGVHAKGQVANFTTKSRIPPERFSYALNSLLPRDIRIIDSQEVSMDFHSRFSAVAKTYRYSIVNNRSGTAIGWQYYHHVPMALILPAMEQAIQYFRAPMTLQHSWLPVHRLNPRCEQFTMPNLKSRILSIFSSQEMVFYITWFELWRVH